MSKLFYCNPYDIDCQGFYFDDLEELNEKLEKADFEEYQIECIDYDYPDEFERLFDGRNFEEVTEFLYGLNEYEALQVEFLCWNHMDIGLDSVKEIYRDVMIYEGDIDSYIYECIRDGIMLPHMPEEYIDYVDLDKVKANYQADFTEWRRGKWCVNCGSYW